MQVFTIGSGRNGTKSMAIILGTVFKKSFHEYNMLTSERRRVYFDPKWMGPRLKAKIAVYKKMGEFHDADNCNTYYIQHLCKIFPESKILIPIGSMESFVRAHRVWGIMSIGDVNINTRAYPKGDRYWNSRPTVVKLAWLWGTRNIEAIKRSDQSKTIIFKTNRIKEELPRIFNFIGKPINDRALDLASRKHNSLEWDTNSVAKAESEIAAYRSEIETVVKPFRNFLSRWT